jgi:NAD(P)-dependent dehydrogenase (short-subunit alcohol dehydrogenase family)
MTRSSTVSVAVGPLQHQTVVITGGSRGIGLAFAQRFAAAGAHVVLAARTAADVDRAVAGLQAAGADAVGMAVDVSRREQVEALADFAARRSGTANVWINNAAVSGPFGYTHDVPAEAWQQVLQVNLFGTYFGSLAALRLMLPTASGMIINLSGGGATRPQRHLTAYSTSKAAIVNFTRGLARDYQHLPGLKFNVLTPGMVPTDMINQFQTVGEGGAAIKELPRILRLFGTTAEETADLALRIVREQRSGRNYQVLTRRRVFWRLFQSLIGVRR